MREPLNRPKKGFPVPLADWFRGPLRARLEAALFSSDAAWREVLDPALVRAAWNDFQTGAWSGAQTLYALWLHEIWRRKFDL